MFNLAGQAGVDPMRVLREKWEREERERARREFADKMQRTLSECPGFVGADAPASEEGTGRIVIEPGMIVEAMPWLRRRFHVSENLALSVDQGLAIDLMPRVRRKGSAPRKRITFGKVEQFNLELDA